MNNKEVLVVEISGKRPGGVKERPTEKYKINYDHIIISNNSMGYETDWEIVNVPQEFEEWYKKEIKSSENAWYAPMNRTYAIKYAKEHGYKYLIQLDDNILQIGIKTNIGNRKLRIKNNEYLINDMIDILVEILKNTNAGMSGCNIESMSVPNGQFLAERYCYSFFALKLDVCPDIFQGDFEDDIEYRLKLSQMKIPCVQCVPLSYAKTGQAKDKDLSGCRAEYKKQGVLRGEHMRKLYGDIYSCGYASGAKAGRNGDKSARSKQILFKHKLKRFKVGVIIYDIAPIKEKFRRTVLKYLKQQQKENNL